MKKIKCVFLRVKYNLFFQMSKVRLSHLICVILGLGLNEWSAVLSIIYKLVLITGSILKLFLL